MTQVRVETMKDAGASVQRYWLLDRFGHFVDHDVLRDSLHTTAPGLTRLPGIFFEAQAPLADTFPVILQKLVSLPMPLPPLTARRLPGGCFCLISEAARNPSFMRTTPDFKLDFTAREVNGWEHLFPLPEAFIHAHTVLANDAIVAISSSDEATQGSMKLEADFTMRFGDTVFPLDGNVAPISSLAAEFPLKRPFAVELNNDSCAVNLTVTPRD